jgi:hypothetical protein
MSAASLLAPLQALAALEGLLACAVVDVDTGMVCQSAGDAACVPLAEAASDYWRLCRRQQAFDTLGPVRAQVLIHERARLTLAPCGRELLLVCASAEPDRVDWARWKQAVAHLHAVARLL